nr:DUF2637 domain-containing protein [Virgisporangium ochraceum]
MTPRQLHRIRWAVRAVLTLGIAASIAANVLHAEPNPIAQSIAAWPPIALLLTVELVGRVPVSRRLGWVRALATAVIAGIAAWVSYWHMVGVAQRYGETDAAPYLIPLSVDGLVVVASVCLVELTGQIRAVGLLRLQAPERRAKRQPGRPSNAQVRPAAAHGQSVTAPTPAKPRRIAPAKSRADVISDAIAAVLRGADVEETARAAGVTPRTLQRWADEAAEKTRRPRGGPRRQAAEPQPEGELVAAGASTGGGGAGAR